MRILVDYQIFLAQKYGGISIYHSIIHRLINGMQTGDSSVILALGSKNEYIQSTGGLLRPLNHKGKKLLRAVNQYRSKTKISGFDVFHPTYYDDYFLKTKNLPPFVLTIHDVIPERFFFDEIGLDLQRRRKALLSRAARVIAPSEATKKGLIEFYRLDEEKIAVIPHGRPDYFDRFQAENGSDHPDACSGHPDAGAASPYILFIGKRGSYKNFNFFIRSVAPFLIRHHIRVKVVGPPPTKEEIDLIAALHCTPYTIFEGSATEKQLFYLYKHACCFVYPALEEGFGIPLLEAASADCPVLCSDTDVFREVCGDSALYFDPTSQDSIRQSLEELLATPSLRTDLIAKARRNLERFSWDAAAKATLETYRIAAGTSHTAS